MSGLSRKYRAHQLYIHTAFSPGIIYLLSFFYLRHEVGFRCGLFASAAPLASTFAGALAYGITSGHSRLANWRLLFLVEGLATVIMVPVAFFFIPDSPDKARFLSSEEKEIVQARAMRQVGTEPSHRIGALNGREFLQALVDYKAWFVAVRTKIVALPTDILTILETAHVLCRQRKLCQLACLSAHYTSCHGL